MKLIPKSKDAIALTCVSIVTLGFFISGLLEVLDYFIIQVLLFLSFGALFIVALGYAIKNDVKKNRLEDTPQDDSH